VLGGVCSGLGAFFNLDPIILRVLFIVFAFAGGVSIVLYLILWIIVPPARTAAQRLEMRGEEVTIENIERSVREEYDAVKNNVRKYGRSETYKGARTAVGEMFHVLGLIILGIARVIVVICGLFFILFGFGMMLAFLTGIILTQPFLNNIFLDSNITLQQLSSIIMSPSDYQWMLLAASFAICIPLLALMYAGIKMVVRFKAKDGYVLLTFLVVWIISAVLTTSLVVIKVKDYAAHSYKTNAVALTEFKNRTIVVDIDPAKIDSLKKRLLYFESNGGNGVYFNREHNEYFVKPYFSIFKADSIHSGLVLESWTMGKDRQEARHNGEDLKYHWSQNDTALFFEPVYEMPAGKAWCMPHLNVNLYIPVDTKVVFTARALNFLNYSDANIDRENWDEWNSRWEGKVSHSEVEYLMGPEGLKMVK
jgi:phage shock protein PspC (stress-responsive transcriptional regulator)